ncbi:MAG: metal-dependent hydrolase [Candidatus Bathyarchaeota archaeon]|jgi:membrane-bound metal-dependent hydrolase YbcI (DUF457 family)|nr:metal-dependent hydrolase [Candidatus Bathyarchaeota archaeon]
MSLGYLLGKISAKILKIQINTPLILVLSIIPDIDIILELLVGNPVHRGPTHSLFFAFLIFIPFFLIFKTRVIPYFVALASHSVLADFFIGGEIQLLWPLTESEFSAAQFGFSMVQINDPINIALELILFIFAILVMLKAGDFLKFFRSNISNFLLIIPVITVLLPTFTSYPLPVPNLLAFPHLFYLIVFVISGLVALKKILL